MSAVGLDGTSTPYSVLRSASVVMCCSPLSRNFVATFISAAESGVEVIARMVNTCLRSAIALVTRAARGSAATGAFAGVVTGAVAGAVVAVASPLDASGSVTVVDFEA